jgi:hypothetical protein
MAVVQISRIQHRRGRKNQGSGLPQLASGEIGWAIDTQELYIGNGAVSEGAPQVGNTKILTEADDLLTTVGNYAYKRGEIQTGEAISSPVERTLQEKLDDIVNVRDFGVESSTEDQTVKIQRAIDQLFLNPASKGLAKSRIKLYFPAGEYYIGDTGLRVPPYANLIGDGIDKTTILSLADNAPAHIFQTINDTSVPGTYADPSTTDSTNMARNITIKDMTITHTSYGGAILLENCKDSEFENIKINGSWSNGLAINSDGDPASNWIGIYLSNGSVATATTDNNIFKNVHYNGLSCAVWSDYDINFNKFMFGKAENCGIGFSLGGDALTVLPVGKQNGSQHTLIKDYVFDAIDKQGIYVRTGNYNRSESNTFLNVGRDNSSSVVVTPVIEFYKNDATGISDADYRDMDFNSSVNDYFQRTQELTVDDLYFSQDYLPEIKGSKRTNLSFPVKREIGAILDTGSVETDGTTIIRLPADSNRGTIELSYMYRAEVSPGPVYQQGTIKILYNKLYTGASISFNDDYVFTGNPSKAGLLVFGIRGNAFQNGDTEIHINAFNTVIDSLSPVDDELEFTIKYIV